MEYYGQTVIINDELKKTAGALEDVAGEYAQTLKVLYNHIDELGAMWGEGLNRKFPVSFEIERPILENMAAILSDYAQALRDNARIYDGAERDVTDIFCKPPVF